MILLEGVLSEAEAALLIEAHRVGAVREVLAPLETPAVAPIAYRLLDLLDEPWEALTAPGFLRVEHRRHGHHWHTDNAPHMPWTRRTVSVLLTPPEAFRQDGPSLEGRGWSVSADEHYLSAAVIGTGETHRVLPHTGNRIVLLAFLR